MYYSADSDLTLSVMTLRNASLIDRVKAARGAGFQGIGWRLEDVDNAGMDEVALVKLFADYQIKPVEIEFFRDWIGLENEAAYLAQEDRLLHFADVLQAKYINVAVFHELADDTIISSLKRLCLKAAPLSMIVQLEFMPYTPPVNSLRTAWDIVRVAGEPNAGLLIDAWHWGHAKDSAADLSYVPAERITGIQLSDDMEYPLADMVEESRHDRMIPGSGALNIPEFIKTLSDYGVQAPLSVEVMSDQLDALPPDEAARLVATGTRDVLKKLG